MRVAVRHAEAVRVEVVGALSNGLRMRRIDPIALHGLIGCARGAFFPPRFLVLLVEDDGGQVVLRDTGNYADAIMRAEEGGAEWGVPVLDRVVE